MENYDLDYDLTQDIPENYEIINVVEEDEVIETPSVPVDKKYGRVCGCFKLNVRELPAVTGDNSGIITVLSNGDTVQILDDSSVDGWTYVRTIKVIEGYCMNNYIEVIN